LEISVKVGEFFKKEENCWMKLENLTRAVIHATLPTFEKRIKNNTSLDSGKISKSETQDTNQEDSRQGSPTDSHRNFT